MSSVERRNRFQHLECFSNSFRKTAQPSYLPLPGTESTLLRSLADKMATGVSSYQPLRKNECENRISTDLIDAAMTPSSFGDTSTPITTPGRKMASETHINKKTDNTCDVPSPSISTTPVLGNATSLANHGFSFRVDNSSTTGSDSLLLELVLPMTVRCQSVDEGKKLLGISLRCGKSPNGISRLILLRLTDPLDPFFLYEMELLEEDYGTFKQELELVVDFNGFPNFLVDMLHGIENSTLPYTISFLAHWPSSAIGILRIVENTHFRTMEQLSLCLIRQGDAGQKKHLAERFQHFELAFTRGSAAWTMERDQLMSSLDNSRREMRELLEKYKLLQEHQRASEADKEKECSNAISSLRDQHELVLKNESEAHSAAVKALQESFHCSQQELLADLRQKDDTLQQVQRRYNELDAEHAHLEADHRLLQTNTRTLEEEVQSLRHENEELKKTRDEALESLASKGLLHATLTERMNGLAAALKAKSGEFELLKEQYDQQNTLISSLTSQNKHLLENINGLEKNIEKAHYIIGTQIHSLKNIKDRYRVATEQIRTQEQLLGERQATLTRVKEELENTKEKMHHTQQRNTQLEAQTEKAYTSNEELSKELQTMREALIKMHKSGSIGGNTLPHRLVYSTPIPGLKSFSRTSNSNTRDGVARFHIPLSETADAEGVKAGHFPHDRRLPPPMVHSTDLGLGTCSFSSNSTSVQATSACVPVKIGDAPPGFRFSPSLSPDKAISITSSLATRTATERVTTSPTQYPLHFSNVTSAAEKGKVGTPPPTVKGDVPHVEGETSSHIPPQNSFQKDGQKGFHDQLSERTFFGSEGALAMPRSAYFS